MVVGARYPALDTGSGAVIDRVDQTGCVRPRFCVWITWNRVLPRFQFEGDFAWVTQAETSGWRPQTRALAKGQLSKPEFEHRISRVYAATIRDDLRPVLEDLEEYQLVRVNKNLWRYWLD